MSKKPSPENLVSDFAKFVSAPELAPPARLSVEILGAVRAELNPRASKVFAKLGLIQVFVGALVLAMCPQFGLSILPGMGLMTLFMRFGETACMTGCGAVFLGASGLLGSLVLTREELLVIRRSRFLQAAVMATLASGVFVCLGGEMVISLGLAWVMGALVGGLGSFELGWLLRSRLRGHVL
ncbi:MAG: hypothetical protein HY074_06930 [Deltaproteobacteria bacterium]|nr:hypothetical protein [Deltaproteobacteria bacterium]